MNKTPNDRFHLGLTPEAVIDAALELTRESHLFSWSIRDLAKRLGANPSTIYHHVGNKATVCRRVVERVTDRLVIPASDLEWQAWMREFLLSLAPIMMEYPGTSKWIMMHGPTGQNMLCAMAVGLPVLSRAGFGDRAYHAGAALLNAVLMTIATGDDRLQQEEDGSRHHSAILKEFQSVAAILPSTEGFLREMIRPFAAGGESAYQARLAYIRFEVEITLSGLEIWLADGAPSFMPPSKPSAPDTSNHSDHSDQSNHSDHSTNSTNSTNSNNDNEEEQPL